MTQILEGGESTTQVSNGKSSLNQRSVGRNTGYQKLFIS